MMAYPNPNPYPAQQPFPYVNAPMLTMTTALISPQYCAPYPLDLAIVRKFITINDGFEVVDINGNIVFAVKGSLMTLRDCRVLMDPAGNPIVTLRRKIITLHDRWQAFRGESTEAKDLIFSLKQSSLIQFRTKLNVYLANNTKEDVCDFQIKGSWLERSCVVYAGDESNHIVARQEIGRYSKMRTCLWKKSLKILSLHPGSGSKEGNFGFKLHCMIEQCNLFYVCSYL